MHAVVSDLPLFEDLLTGDDAGDFNEPSREARAFIRKVEALGLH